MTEITFQIPDEKLDFILELMGQLGIEVVSATDIPLSQQQEILKRIASEKMEEMVPWELARKQLNFGE